MSSDQHSERLPEPEHDLPPEPDCLHLRLPRVIWVAPGLCCTWCRGH